MSLVATRIMGVLNVTPDSFYGESRVDSVEEALARARTLVEHGADILDIGGESSRPGADPVSEEEELRRVVPVIEALVSELDIPLSIDTTRPTVAEACLQRGVRMVNDISGLANPQMKEVVGGHCADVVVMHMRGTPATMHRHANYGDLVGEVKSFLSRRAEEALGAGARSVIVDPGIGFAKTASGNLELLMRLREICELGYPVLFGASRKSFLGVVTGGLPPEDRLEASLAAGVIAVMNGAEILRVHDVQATWRAVRVADAARNVLHVDHGQDHR